MRCMGQQIAEKVSLHFKSTTSQREKLICFSMMVVSTTIHAFSLVMEMLIIHVALTSSIDSCFTYVFLDCFNELKLNVFKKCNYTFLNQVTRDDSVERFQIAVYILATLM
jgi:hypothetical protein